ncbi:MAG TPA: NAD(P)/FAD-dependent oxidoreductase [Steroidobacteraceae bacterium]|nr:NAD(P)/FAD-dependent oxidoreductase [Steroidobacteraceae bacterium]
MDELFDAVVIGAGVVGLAVARSLALHGRSVLVLERHALPAQETSSRNSGVIHSGIYYPDGSLKARLCVRGRALLYDYVQQKGIAYRRCGKLIVAQQGQQLQLEALHRQALQNGVTDLQLLGVAAAREYEPAVRCVSALWSPSTGIVDVHELAHALIGDIESAGGSLAYRTTVDSVRFGARAARLACRSGGDSLTIEAALVINSAGLDAIDLLRRFEGYPAGLLRQAWYAKGNYFSLIGSKPFRHLVYPMPDDAGLGIHATLDLNGAIRFGPNVQWVPSPEYNVEPRQVDEFYASIRRYWPDLAEGALQPDYAGVRPKLVGPEMKPADFLIEGAETHGCPALINLLGIESPGLTSSLAIGEYVANQLPNSVSLRAKNPSA